MPRWFRVYDDLVNDPKVQRLEPALFKFLINIWCLASSNGGKIPTIEQLQFSLREPDASLLVASLEALVHHGLADRFSNQHGSWLAPHSWSKRQYKSDLSTDRVKRFRSASRAATGNGDGAPPETDTDSEKKKGREEKQVNHTHTPLAESQQVEEVVVVGKESSPNGDGSERQVLSNFDFASDDGSVVITAEEFTQIETDCPSVKNIRGLARHACRSWLETIAPDERKTALLRWFRKKEAEKAAKPPKPPTGPADYRKIDMSPAAQAERDAERERSRLRRKDLERRQEARKNGHPPP
jgi:hypothetical protein